MLELRPCFYLTKLPFHSRECLTGFKGGGVGAICYHTDFLGFESNPFGIAKGCMFCCLGYLPWFGFGRVLLSIL